jgi:hypothetical protein
MVDKQDSSQIDIEIGTSEDIIDCIKEFRFDRIGIPSSYYVYMKKIGNHLVVGKADITFRE